MSTLPSSTLAEGTDTALSGAYKLTGPLLIGCFLNLILYGVLCTQVYIYYISFPKDRLASKGIVYVLWFTETLQTILNAYVIFDIFCFDFGNFPALDKVNLTWFSVPILSGLIGCISQLFYAWRMYAFSKKAPWLSMILSVIAFTQFAGAIACGIQARRYGYFSDLYAKAKVPILVWLSASVLCDVAIALCMTYHLNRAASTGLMSTRVLVSRLIRLTVETGILTAAFAVIDIVLFLACPHDIYHSVPAVCLAKLYSNTVLAVCNSRMAGRIRGGREDASLDAHESFDLSDARFNVELQNIQNNTSPGSPLQLEGDQEDKDNTKTIDILPPDKFSFDVSTVDIVAKQA